MIAKGNLHGDGGKLARYLMTGEKGEIAELLQTRGLENLGGDPVQAFATLQKVAEANTKSPLPFFHTQTRLPHGENLTDAQLLQVADRQEKRLGFTGQPRIASVHILPTGDRHLHVGWFRIDRETMQAIDPGLFKNHLKFLCRKLEKEFCLQEVSNFRKPDDLAPAASRKEQEEARRLGTDDRAVRNAILNCLEAADGGKAFRAALDERGLMLANGDKRDCFVVVDQAGGHHALNKGLTGHTLGELRDRLADLDRTQLPSVEQAQEIQRARRAERDRAAEIDRAAQAAMQAAHAQARGKYDSLRETERKVSRDQFPGRYDNLRAAEPPPEVVREFDASANRAAEPPAPIYDRDQDNAAWEAKLAENAINAEAQKGHQQPGGSAARETSAYADLSAEALAKAEEATADRRAGAQQRPEPEDMRPLGKVAGEIRTAWNLTRNAKEDLRRDNDELETALAARGISLAEVSAEEARQSQRTAAFAKEVGNYARVLREGEIVAIDQYGAVHRFDQRTTGDLRPEIEARFAGIDRASLMNVTDTKEAMQEASRETWRAERQAEREQARPASWIEQRIAECADVARKEGATIQQDREGRRVGGIEALTDSLRPEGQRETKEAKVFEAEAFAALLQDAGIAIARVTDPDTRVLDSWREELTKDRMLSDAVDEIYQGNRIDALVMGELAAVTRKGDVYRINPEKLGDAGRHIGDDLPGVIETQARLKVERAATADIWAEMKAANAEDRAARNAAFEGDRTLHRNAAAAERVVENTLGTADDAVNVGLDAASGIGSKLAKAVENILGGIFSFFGAAEPKLTPMQMHDRARAESNEETLHARAYTAAEQQKEAEADERIFNQDRQQQQEEQSFAARYGTPGSKSAGREREDDYDRGRERER